VKSIILLHGAIGAEDQLQPLAKALTKLNYQVFSFSFSGHGQTPFEANYSIQQFAGELEKFILRNQLTKPHVFGYSMGGYVALYLAYNKPQTLGRIITLGTKFKWTKEIAQNEIKQLDPKLISEKVPKFAESLSKRHGADWELVLKRTAEMMVQMGESNPLKLDMISNIETEVLIGIADKDAMVTLEETTQVYQQLKKAHMFMLPNTKHPIETVDVEALSHVVNKFVG
jgi:esterase/lipase